MAAGRLFRAGRDGVKARNKAHQATTREVAEKQREIMESLRGMGGA